MVCITLNDDLLLMKCLKAETIQFIEATLLNTTNFCEKLFCIFFITGPMPVTSS
jgi:hypothetical protein